MTYHAPRGILRAQAATDPNAVLGELTTAFASFKASHKSEVAELRQAVDDMAAHNANAQMSGNRGSLRHEDRDHEKAFANWLRNPTDTEAAHKLSAAESAVRGMPQASGNTLSGAAGGFAVPQPVFQGIRERILETSPLRRLASVFQVNSTGTKFLVNRNNASSAWVGETDTRNDTNEPTLDLRAPSFGTVFGLVEATEELLLDSAIDIRSWFTNACAQRVAQAEGLAFVSGNGTNKPLGFLAGPTPVTTADATRDAGTLQYVPTGEAAAINVDSLRAIYFSLKAAHRQNASWLMSSATASVLVNLKDSEGRSLWQPSLSADTPATLMGRPVFYAEDMPDIGANAFPIAFGDFMAGYLIADSGGLRITIDDNITKPGFVRFYVRQRVGGNIYDSEAIRLLKVAAS